MKIHVSIAVAACASTSAFAQTKLWQHKGAGSYASCGLALASTPDIDGDGLRDLIFPENSATTRNIEVRSGVNGALLLTIPTPAGASQFAWAISGGDFDNDGVGDVVASSYMESLNFPGSGAVRVFSGATANVLLTISGPAGSARFGESLDTLDDVDNDGFIDLIVGAPGVKQVVIVRGSDGSTMRTISAGANEQYVGGTVANAGDTNGDGRGDYLVSGVVGATGFADLYSGATGGLLHRFTGSQSFGLAIASAGDVDNDNRADVVIGADGFGTVPGHAYVYSGANYAQLYDFSGSCDPTSFTTAYDRFGVVVRGVGDVDNDSHDDIAVGATRNRYVSVFSGLTGALLGQAWENIPDTANTIRFCGMGDLDGDGDADFAVGDLQYSSSSFTRAGRVRVFTSIAPVSVGTPFGFGDGTGAACPCGNTGQLGAGCANSTGMGAELRAFGSSSVTGDELHFEIRHVPIGSTGLVGSGSSLIGGGNGVVYGDGLRATIGALKRSPLQNACPDGAILLGPGFAFSSLWLAGQTRHYQAYYRDAAGPCGSTFNTSNGVSVTFTP